MIYLQLFWEYFKISIVSFGGMASIPFLFDLSRRYGWFTISELSDMIAISESTPGPIAINMATFSGFQTAGILGSVAATIGLMAPPTIISLIVGKALQNWEGNKYLQAAFTGLRPATAGLLAAAGVSLVLLAVFGTDTIGAGMELNLKSLIFFLILLPLIFRFPKHPLVFIALGAVVGIVFRFQ